MNPRYSNPFYLSSHLLDTTLATSEGTLVASYNRGMKVLNLCGGVHSTVVADAMHCAPVFVLSNARGTRICELGTGQSDADPRSR